MLALYLELTTSYGLGSGSQLRELKSAIVDAPRDTLRVSVPAGLCTLQNILIFALGNLEVVSFQVLYQTKLMLTAVLSVLMLGRTLTVRQWVSRAAHGRRRRRRALRRQPPLRCEQRRE